MNSPPDTASSGTGSRATGGIRSTSGPIGWRRKQGGHWGTDQVCLHLTSLSMEMVPRITRAQSMDALSSMSTVAGYRAVLMAAQQLPRFFPMLVTAAGTLAPAKALILGAGVAGLQAMGQGYNAAIDLCTLATMANLGVDVVGEIEHRRAQRQVQYLPPGC